MARLGFDRLEATIERFETPVGLRLQNVRLWAGPTVLDTRAGTVAENEPPRFEALLAPDAIQEFLVRKSPGGLEKIRISTGPEGIRLEGVRRVLVEFPVVADVALRLEGDREIHLEVVRVEVLGTGLSQFVRNKVDEMNPVFTVDDLPFPARLTGIETGTGGVIVRGEVDAAGSLGLLGRVA